MSNSVVPYRLISARSWTFRGHSSEFDWHGFVVSSVPNDYDAGPARWTSLDRSTQLTGDVHAPVAALIVERCRGAVLDVGGGDGELARHLPNGWPTVVVDTSRQMLQRASGPASSPMPHLCRSPTDQSAR